MPDTEPMDIHHAARLAIDLQNCCNLEALLHTYQRVLTEALKPLCESRDDMFNHPVSRLFASKVHSLTNMGLSDTEAFEEAYKACEELAEKVSRRRSA